MALVGDGNVTLNDVMTLLKSIDGRLAGGTIAPSQDGGSQKEQRPCSDVGNSLVPPINGPISSWADPNVIDRVLFSKEQIQKRVKELAASISQDYSDATEDSFVVVGLLTGVYLFMADITRELSIPHQIDFISASSYGLGTTSTGDIKIKKDLDAPIEGKDVLLIDEMCDSGNTMVSIRRFFEDRGAKSVRTCVFLDKVSRRTVPAKLDYVGFQCEDEFLVGYGMDWAKRFRSLPDVCVVKRSAYEK
eukprot:TRINITY_DN17974_c0_g1_i1.p1 TRINITY_DN17974_c0_g1~~TRINITY_DN17974_c0_g1_i1.p1  ORF type:complete len:247 (+),score=37.03 TRINITY_DN17974_c0_g1_i1:167-907(+)